MSSVAYFSVQTVGEWRVSMGFTCVCHYDTNVTITLAKASHQNGPLLDTFRWDPYKILMNLWYLGISCYYLFGCTHDMYT